MCNVTNAAAADSAMRRAMTPRIPVSGTRSAGSMPVSLMPIAALSAAARTSSSVMRPPGPVPDAIDSISMSSCFASLRARGVATTLPPAPRRCLALGSAAAPDSAESAFGATSGRSDSDSPASRM